MENKACRICGSEAFINTYQKKYQYVKCKKCNTERIYPYPTVEEMNDYYQNYLNIKKGENQNYMLDENWESFRMIKELTFQDLDFELNEFKNKKLLDVGCATGQFVQFSQDNGAIPYGIDISDELIQVAMANGLNCENKPLEKISEKFDIISLWHVIEHVEDPRQMLIEIRERLSDNGIFFIETPCTGDLSELFKEDWRFYMPIEHIHLFSQDSLFKLLDEVGFTVENWIRFGSGNTAGTIQSNIKSIFDKLAKKYAFGDTISIKCMLK